jgi:hypothetical protein
MINMDWWRIPERAIDPPDIYWLRCESCDTKVDVDEMHEDGYCEGCLEYCRFCDKTKYYRHFEEINEEPICDCCYELVYVCEKCKKIVYSPEGEHEWEPFCSGACMHPMLQED